MRIAALYKVWSGEEWLHASVDSIMPYVEKVVIVLSSKSWIGGKGNPSNKAVLDLMEKYKDRVEVIATTEQDQMEQCMIGYRWIQENVPCDYVQLIDSDEVWDEKNYLAAIEFIRQQPGEKAYRTQMYTYVKSALLRVDPPEPLKPVCFIRADLDDMGLEPRGCGLHPFVTMDDVWCHHFVLVRYHFNKVLEKIVQSHVSEKQMYEDMSVWIPEVWNKLPDYNKGLFPNGLHMAIGFGHNWKELIRVSPADLPATLSEPGYVHLLGYGG
jgi:hypothetical protein